MRWFVLAITALFATSASAGSIAAYGELRCDGTTSVVRFAPAANDERTIFPELPASAGLELLAAIIDGNTCTLENGREVKVKLGERQQFPYGLCGAGLKGFASLWIAGREVLSRRWVVRSRFSGPFHYDLIIYREGELTLCRSEAARAPIGDPLQPECRDATIMLLAAAWDGIESAVKNPEMPPLGSVSITYAEDQGFCDAFLESLPDQGYLNGALSTANSRDRFHSPASMSPSALRSGDRKPWLDRQKIIFPMDSFQQPDFHSLYPRTDCGYWGNGLASAWFDFDSDGVEDLVFRDGGVSRFFDCQKYYVARGDVAVTLSGQIAKSLTSHMSHSRRNYKRIFLRDGLTVWIDPLKLPMPEYHDRYTYQEVLQARLGTLVFAAGRNRRVRPTDLIYRPFRMAARNRFASSSGWRRTFDG